MSHKRLLELTESVYDAAMGETPWAVVGRRLTELLGARSASLMMDDLATGETELLYHSDFPSDAIVAYQRHYRAVDLWTNRAAQAVKQRHRGAPRAWTSGHLVPDAEFLSSEFYNDFGRQLGLRYVVGTVLSLGADCVVPVGLHRPERDASFGEPERNLLERVLPHLRRALQLRRQLATPSCASSGLAALDAISLGVLVVNAEMQVLVANNSAEAMVSSGSALRMTRAAGGACAAKAIVTVGNRVDGKALAGLVRATALGGLSGGAVLLRSHAGTAALAAVVAPLPRRLSDAPGDFRGRIAGQALILMRDLAIPPAPPPPELLRTLFGLTHAEAEIACAMSGGATKESVAAMRGLRVTTVRTQVRAVLAKTGAVNLRDLERLLGHLPRA